MKVFGRRITLLILLMVTVGQSVPAGASSAMHPAALEPSSGALFGAYVKPDVGWDRDDVTEAIEVLESDLVRTLDVDHHYYPWRVPFPSWKEPWDIAAGRIPMISWGNVSTRRVNSGAVDALIRSRAEGLRDLGSPVFLRWFAEMDGDAVGRVSGSPSSFVRAWRRIRWIFGAAGAWNAVWVWCPNAWGFEQGRAQNYYPGDAYVDWVCADGYNWAPGRKGDRWRPFQEIFPAFYKFGVSSGKPMMVGEYGCQERGIGEKGAWISEARNDIQQQFPELDAIVYFDSDRDYDWRLETSASSYQAFIDMGNDPYFKPNHQALGSVDPARFDSVLADTTAPDVRVPRSRLRAGRIARVRWRSKEANTDFVRLRYAAKGGGGKLIVRRTPDDGRFAWFVPTALRGERIQLSIRAFDLAGNTSMTRSRWLRVG